MQFFTSLPHTLTLVSEPSPFPLIVRGGAGPRVLLHNDVENDAKLDDPVHYANFLVLDVYDFSSVIFKHGGNESTPGPQAAALAFLLVTHRYVAFCGFSPRPPGPTHLLNR